MIASISNSFSNVHYKTVAVTAAVTLAAVWVINKISHISSDTLKQKTIRVLMGVPGLKEKIDEKLQAEVIKLEIDTFKHRTFLFKQLPKEGLSPEEILEKLKEAKEKAVGHTDLSKVSGTIYFEDEKLMHLLIEAFRISLLANPMHSDLFTWVNQCEAEVVSMCSAMMHGGVGTMTSGGTSSIFHACKTYAHRAKEMKIEKPNIVIPRSAHVSFWKAAEILNLEVRVAKLNDKGEVDIEHMKHSIDANTIMITGSAPSYPHGIIDPIGKLSDLACETGIPLHVDACLGGFVAPFLNNLELFDFRLPGVTSISMDTHKFGNTEKGSSVILYRNAEWRKHQYFVNTDWMGGIYMTPTLEGSRSALPIVAAWVSMVYHGEDKYREMANKIVATRQAIQESVLAIPQIKVIGSPQMMVIAFESNDSNVDIYRVAQEMKTRGWNLNLLRNPRSFHFCITNKHTVQQNFAATFTNDLFTSVNEVLKNPNQKLTGTVAAYSASCQYPEELIDKLGESYLDVLYQTDKISHT